MFELDLKQSQFYFVLWMCFSGVPLSMCGVPSWKSVLGPFCRSLCSGATGEGQCFGILAVGSQLALPMSSVFLGATSGSAPHLPVCFPVGFSLPLLTRMLVVFRSGGGWWLVPTHLYVGVHECTLLPIFGLLSSCCFSFFKIGDTEKL